MDLRREGLQRDAALHRQYRLAEPLFRRRAHGGDGGPDPGVLVWTNTPDNIIDIADIYIRTIFWGIPFTLLYNVTSALMRALGDSKRPLYFLLVASVLNIGLDLLCILTFRTGGGSAAAFCPPCSVRRWRASAVSSTSAATTRS